MLEPEQHTETARKPSKLTSGYVLYALLAVVPLLLAWAYGAGSNRRPLLLQRRR